MRHRHIGVKPRVWVKPLEQTFQRIREEAEPPAQWQPTDWWEAAQNWVDWKRIVVIARR